MNNNYYVQKLCNLIDFTTQNICFSPFSLLHALSILLKCHDTEAKQEMLEKLDVSESQIFELKQSLSSTLSIVSNIFCTNAQQLTSFESTIFKCFNLAPEPLVSVDQVNQWCTRNTNGKITEIIDSIIGIECILLSAVHFKANWAFKFDKRSTKNAVFTGFASNSSVQMIRMSRKLQYAQTASAQIVCLDYTAQLSALIILPLQNNIKAFQAALTLERKYQCISN
ncbi:Serpin_1 [Hexamita inflata]|uniref:Serpin_1 n=1 Tax=Hexamita inflata TaxID=28002 RepID=A0ABP1HXC5_9EUKA